jgi:peptidoglycan hydrolase-like protein with peptidoglycan-binding domain
MANKLNAPTIKQGGTDDKYLTSEGVAWVTTLQDMLNKVGNYGLVEDGIFGSKTFTAVENFQNRAGIAVDGVVGNDTWDALYNFWSSGQALPSAKITPVPSAKITPIPSVELPTALGKLNWTTIGIIAAIGFALFMMFSKSEPEPVRERPRKRSRRRR